MWPLPFPDASSNELVRLLVVPLPLEEVVALLEERGGAMWDRPDEGMLGVRGVVRMGEGGG